MSDDNSSLSLTRRRLLGGLTAIGTAGAASGAGTWAYFRDTEQSTGNTVHAGTMDLKISDGDNEFGDGVSGTWTISNAKPGDSVMTNVSLQNAGSLEADHVEIGFSVDETDAGMAEQFEVTLFAYNGSIDFTDLNDANGNGILDLDDLADGNGAALDDLNPPPSANGGTETMTMQFRWAHDSEFDNSVSGVNNDYQGDEFDLTVTYALHQDDSQDL